ncbi:hypothetical protein REPUB_Repub08aG0065200 [Reevesia pubescens]
MMAFFTSLCLAWATGDSSEPKKEDVCLPGGKIKKKEKKEVVIEKVVRNKHNCITTVKGLELFGEPHASSCFLKRNLMPIFPSHYCA